MSEPDGQAAQWLPAARAGSAEAVGQALEACRGYLLMIAQGALDPALQAKGGASDLVQNTLLDALRDFGHFEGNTEAELLHWLRRLLLNNATDFARHYRGTGKRQLGREQSLEPGDSSAERGGGLAADDTSPSGQALARERFEAVHKVLHRLPDDYRQVIVLRYQEERSFEEIGQQLNLTANAARKLLLRAVEKVRQELDESS
jgi:RNA polymerase sigma-70 factor (ECF subfamily)